MTQKTYIVEGRQFRTEADYNRAIRDKELIDRLRKETQGYDRTQLERLKVDLHNGKYKFLTLLGQDYADEVEELLQKKERSPVPKRREGRAAYSGRRGGTATGKDTGKTSKTDKAVPKQKKEDGLIDVYVQAELKKQEKRRKLVVLICSLAAACCLGYFCVYTYYDYKTSASYSKLSELKEKPAVGNVNVEPVIHYTSNEPAEPREVLDEYKNLLNKNKKLIGWIKIDDTNIDYPVMQTSDNEYYLNHNLNQEYDKNGSIFMDKDCDVLKPSTNLILYGHHMKSGQMFGKLDLYDNEEYFKNHRYIQFDTIYEKGTWEVMYVFRSRVYSEEEIAFKYYQFIDALSEQEFNSYMQEMAAMSKYDTGVTAQYGDRLLTLSTCDYKEQDGRFVVVAKKVAKE